METLLCLTHMFWPIVQEDPVNALFWNLISGWKHSKTPPARVLMWTANLHTFAYRWRHRPTPRPLAFDLLTPRRLITTTTTMVDYMLAFVPQKILSLSGLLGQNSAPLPLHWAKKDYGQPTSRFRHLLAISFFFYCLFVYSVQVSSPLFLVNLVKCHL